MKKMIIPRAASNASPWSDPNWGKGQSTPKNPSKPKDNGTANPSSQTYNQTQKAQNNTATGGGTTAGGVTYGGGTTSGGSSGRGSSGGSSGGYWNPSSSYYNQNAKPQNVTYTGKDGKVYKTSAERDAADIAYTNQFLTGAYDSKIYATPQAKQAADQAYRELNFRGYDGTVYNDLASKTIADKTYAKNNWTVNGKTYNSQVDYNKAYREYIDTAAANAFKAAQSNPNLKTEADKKVQAYKVMSQALANRTYRPSRAYVSPNQEDKNSKYDSALTNLEQQAVNPNQSATLNRYKATGQAGYNNLGEFWDQNKKGIAATGAAIAPFVAAGALPGAVNLLPGAKAAVLTSTPGIAAAANNYNNSINGALENFNKWYLGLESTPSTMQNIDQTVTDLATKVGQNPAISDALLPYRDPTILDMAVNNAKGYIQQVPGLVSSVADKIPGLLNTAGDAAQAFIGNAAQFTNDLPSYDALLIGLGLGVPATNEVYETGKAMLNQSKMLPQTSGNMGISGRQNSTGAYLQGPLVKDANGAHHTQSMDSKVNQYLAANSGTNGAAEEPKAPATNTTAQEAYASSKTNPFGSNYDPSYKSSYYDRAVAGQKVTPGVGAGAGAGTGAGAPAVDDNVYGDWPEDMWEDGDFANDFLTPEGAARLAQQIQQQYGLNMSVDEILKLYTDYYNEGLAAVKNENSQLMNYYEAQNNRNNRGLYQDYLNSIGSGLTNGQNLGMAYLSAMSNMQDANAASNTELADIRKQALTNIYNYILKKVDIPSNAITTANSIAGNTLGMLGNYLNQGYGTENTSQAQAYQAQLGLQGDIYNADKNYQSTVYNADKNYAAALAQAASYGKANSGTSTTPTEEPTPTIQDQIDQAEREADAVLKSALTTTNDATARILLTQAGFSDADISKIMAQRSTQALAKSVLG